MLYSYFLYYLLDIYTSCSMTAITTNNSYYSTLISPWLNLVSRDILWQSLAKPLSAAQVSKSHVLVNHHYNFCFIKIKLVLIYTVWHLTLYGKILPFGKNLLNSLHIQTHSIHFCDAMQWKRDGNLGESIALFKLVTCFFGVNFDTLYCRHNRREKHHHYTP